MKTINTSIIPKSSSFINVDVSKELDLEAICCFVATGFFLDTDTYFKHQKVLRPGSIHKINGANELISSVPYFKWHHTPRDITFEEALDEFTALFETIVEEQTTARSVILPLSGGLDSRTQAVALRDHPNVKAYSYQFKGGYPENVIGKRIAKALKFPFNSFKVSSGYLWDCIEELAEINGCYSEFTHPRQMAFIDKYAGMGDVFSLGHLGDLLFDTMHLPQLGLQEEVDVICDKFIKKGGLELATILWKSWGLEGDFESYFNGRIRVLLEQIEIKDTNAKLRAFKSMYSVTRWSSNNLSIFEKVAPIELPYYDNRMCEFICTLPEKYLANRKLQIAYIKRNAPKLASITWHEQKPFHLNNFHLNKWPYNFPYRVVDKLRREVNARMGRPHISRNWELQFLGKENDTHLQGWLFDSGLDQLIDVSVTQKMYDLFKTKDAVWYSHPVSMLLTLAVFHKKFNG